MFSQVPKNKNFHYFCKWLCLIFIHHTQIPVNEKFTGKLDRKFGVPTTKRTKSSRKPLVLRLLLTNKKRLTHDSYDFRIDMTLVKKLIINDSAAF